MFHDDKNKQTESSLQKMKAKSSTAGKNGDSFGK